MSKDGISIIVCCYNSEAVIEAALQSLIAQQLPVNYLAEVILVDNNCTDNTVAKGREIWNRYSTSSMPLCVIKEILPGLTHARKAGVAAAHYDIVIFCDDDNRLAPDYLSVAVSLMQQHPEIGAAGGICKGFTDDVFPAWWPAHAHAYAVGRQGHTSGDISKLQYLWGAGLIARKSILQTVLNDSYPLLLSDRKGALLSSGGDSEICARILLMGYKLWFEEKLQLQHYIHPKRLTETYRENLYQGHAAAMPVLEKYRMAIIERNLSGLKKAKRFLKLAGYLLLRVKNSDYTKVAINIIGNTTFEIKDAEYKIILGLLKANRI